MSSSPAALDAEGRARSTASDVRLITVVCVGHLLSHFYGLVLPPLFPLLRTELGVSYAALGALITASAGASLVPDHRLLPAFQAVTESVEEALLNSLTMAHTVTGFRGHTRQAVPHDLLLDRLAGGRTRS